MIEPKNQSFPESFTRSRTTEPEVLSSHLKKKVVKNVPLFCGYIVKPPSNECLKTPSYALSWLCGLNELSRVFFTWGLSYRFSRRESGAAVPWGLNGAGCPRQHPRRAGSGCQLLGPPTLVDPTRLSTLSLSMWRGLLTAWQLGSWREPAKSENSKRTKRKR